MKPALSVGLLSACAVALPSQTTHFVGPATGLPQVQDALAIAAAGDVVVVAAGDYRPFTLTLPVSIRAATPHATRIVADPTVALEITTIDVPAGTTANLVGLDFEGQNFLSEAMVVLGGRVTLDDCALTNMVRPALAVQDAAVHLQNSSLFGGGLGYVIPTGAGAAIYGDQAIVTAANCSLRADPAGFFFSGAALQLHDSFCQGSQLTIDSVHGEAIDVSNSHVWLSDSSISGGPNSCAIAGNTVHLSRSIASQSCSAVSSADQLGVATSGPITQGGSFTLDFRALPNAFVFVFAGPELATLAVPALLVQPSWLDFPTSFSAALLQADALGNASVSWAIPAGTSFTDQSLWFEGISGLNLPLQVSPVVGGIVR